MSENKINQHVLITEIAKELEVPRKNVAAFYDAFTEKLVEKLAEGKDVELTRILLLEHVETKARKGRNPQSGEPIDVPAKNKIKARTRIKLHALTKEV